MTVGPRAPVPVTATVIALAIDRDGPCFGVAFLGASGSGKTAAAISLIRTCPWQRTRLIGDDAVLIEARDADLWVSSPPDAQNIYELRGAGFGLCPTSSLDAHPLRVAFRLGGDGARLAAPGAWRPLGHGTPSVPVYRLDAAPLGIVGFLRRLWSGHSLPARFE